MANAGKHSKRSKQNLVHTEEEEDVLTKKKRRMIIFHFMMMMTRDVEDANDSE